MYGRTILPRLRRRASTKLGRILVLTGARQAGKTTLARQAFPDLAYISVEDPTLRPVYSRLSAAEWIERFPRAIIDEVQKAPSIVESIKAAYDASGEVGYVLLGSSQILLLTKVKESLAGRAAIEDLWPLTLPELATSSGQEPVSESRLVTWIRSQGDAQALLGVPAESRSFARASADFERYLRFGGMPAVQDPALADDERQTWLHDYQRTYLERDVADLATLRDLEPFVLAQKAIAGRTACTVNWSDLARVISVAPATAQRFLRYLELSYQVLKLPPFFRNLDKRLAKAPKIHFLDPGILRAILNRSGEPTGAEFESAVVAEVYKQLHNAALRASFYHLRTHDGREVDLLIEVEAGFIAIEIKRSPRVAEVDARHLRGLETLLDKPVIGRLLLSLDRDARRFVDGTLAVPTAWALSAPTD